MIRPTEPKDTDALIEIAHRTGVFKPIEISALGERLNDFYARDKARGHLSITLEHEGVPVGFAYYAPAEAVERLWLLKWIAVDIRLHGRGIGTTLLTHAETDVRRRRGRLLLIETSTLPHYAPIHAFCKKLEYEQTALVRDYFADGDHMVVFSKRLIPVGHVPPSSVLAEAPAPPSYPPHVASLDEKTLAGQCSTRFTRRSGPGGQNRNKVETAVVVVHRPTGLGAEGSEERSQAENLKAAMFRLRMNLALKIRQPRDPENTPSPLWRSRCPDGQILVSPKHNDYPTMMAEALDVLNELDLDLKSASTLLQTSPSQLIKLFKSEPRALLHVNDERRKKDLHPLV